MSRPLRPLVLTGGPAVGKTTVANALATSRGRCAVIDVDDVRQFVRTGHVAPWEGGGEGEAQQRLGVRNAAALTMSFLGEGIEVVIADVLTPDTAALYRQLIPTAYVIKLDATLEEARRRSAMRREYLQASEFAALHREQKFTSPAIDDTLDVNTLGVDEQVETILDRWLAAGELPG